VTSGWRTTISNHRPAILRRLARSPGIQLGFSDAGAHVRNMAFYSFPLRMLRFVRDHQVMPIEKAVQKMTRQTAEWLGLDAGSLAPGAWADVAVIDPEKLKTGLSDPIEQYDPRLGGAMRMVKRSDGVVRQVLVGGRVAFEDGQFADDFGRQRYGRLLRSAR